MPFAGFCAIQFVAGLIAGRMWALALPLLIFVVTFDERNDCIGGSGDLCGWTFYALAFFPVALACVGVGVGTRAALRPLARGLGD